jgi:hypothetical protein
MPNFVKGGVASAVYVPGGAHHTAVVLGEAVILYASRYNPGAEAAGGQLVNHCAQMASKAPGRSARNYQQLTIVSAVQKRLDFTSITLDDQTVGTRSRQKSRASIRMLSIVKTTAATNAGEMSSAPVPAPPPPAPPASLQSSASALMRSLRGLSGRRVEEGEATHFLLYLNHDTWLEHDGQCLASEVRLARAHMMPIVMIHENQADLGGCEFGRFFQT